MKVKVYGGRGTAAFFSRDNLRFGGNTACVMLDIGGYIVILDCGSGLMQFYYDMKGVFKDTFKFDVLLSHLHIDHIIGFSAFPPLLSPNSDIRIFTRKKGAAPLTQQIFGIFKPPYWPIDIAAKTTAKTIEITCEQPFSLNDNITVTPFCSQHHGETVSFRVDANDKSIVYLLDYEVDANPDKYGRLVELCRNADLVIMDAAYLPEDYPERRGWGHSTYEHGIDLANASSCKKMILSHICQDYSDDVLKAVEERLDDTRLQIVHDGMEIIL